MSRIETTFRALRRAGECALIPYLTVGYPTLAETVPLVRAISAGGADILELGVPFSDPLADGPTIQEASQVALDNGVTVAHCLDVVTQIRKADVGLPIVLMGYCNPFLRYGVARLARDAALAGVDGLVVPDLPPDQAEHWIDATKTHGLDLIFFLAPTTSDARLRTVVRYGSGFIYCISVAGVTGARAALDDDLPSFLARVRATTDLPLAVGFGISTTQHVGDVAALADAAIVGSALITAIRQSAVPERPGVVRAYIESLKSATRRGG